MKKVWAKFWPKCSRYAVKIFSRISRSFSREMGQFFSHLARNEKREKCACLFRTLLPFWFYVKSISGNFGSQKLVKFRHAHFSRFLFLARCEKNGPISREKLREMREKIFTLKPLVLKNHFLWNFFLEVKASYILS